MLFLDVDPSQVKPGWTPLIITILLAAAIALLMISMRRQIRKINAPRRNEMDGEPTTRGPEVVDADESSDADRSDETGRAGEPGRTERAADPTTGDRHPITHG